MSVRSCTLVAVVGACVGGCDRTLDPSWGQGGYAELSSPTIGIDGAVMFTSHGERDAVVCLAVVGGGFGWAVPLDGGSAGTVPVVADDGTAYVADGAWLRVIDRHGELAASRPVDGVLGAAPAIGHGGDLLLAGATTDGGFLEATTADGEPRWRRELDAPVTGQPMVRRDGAVVVETEHALLAFDDAGERLWERALEPSAGMPGGIGGSDAAVVVRGGSLVVVDRDGGIAWTVDGAVGSPAIAHGEVIVPMRDGLLALDERDGSERWHVARSCGPAAIGRDGHAYAGCVTDGALGLVEIDGQGEVVYEDAFLPAALPRSAPVLASGHAVLTADEDVIGWDGAAPLAGSGSPRAGSDNGSTGRAR